MRGGAASSGGTLVWVSRDGEATHLEADHQPGQYASPRVSPDGSRVAVSLAEDPGGGGGLSDLWVFDLTRGTRSRITFEGNNRFFPVWTHDGTRLTWADGITSANRLVWAPADGSGPVSTLLEKAGPQFPTDWSPDGQVLAFYESHPETQRDLWVLPMSGNQTPELFLRTPFQERAATFSPDGRWLAYVSNKSGQDEVYVRPYPGPGEEHVISTRGGKEPVWSPDGHELFYRRADEMMVVAVDTAEMFHAGPPTVMFVGRYDLDNSAGGLGGVPNYDVAPDGQRFVMVKETTADPPQLIVVLNWHQELKARVPVP